MSETATQTSWISSERSGGSERGSANRTVPPPLDRSIENAGIWNRIDALIYSREPARTISRSNRILGSGVGSPEGAGKTGSEEVTLICRLSTSRSVTTLVGEVKKSQGRSILA